MRAYNAEGTILRAIQSVLDEENFNGHCELVVINDGSKDRTLEIMEPYKDNARIRIINQDNSGAMKSAINGFREAKGQWIMILDADDYLVPGALGLVMESITENADADFLYFDYFEGWDNDFELVSPQSIWESLAGGMIVRREELTKAGFWDITLMFPEYDLILKTWGVWKIVYIPKPLFYYFRRPGSLSTNPDNLRNTLSLLKSRYPDKLELISKIRTY